MSYPTATMWGTGAPEISLAVATATEVQGRIENNNESLDVFSLEHPSEIQIGFDKVRRDGGKNQVILQNGTVVPRADGYRVNITLSWLGLSATNVREIAKIYDWSLTGSVFIRPHDDVTTRYKVTPTSEFNPTYSGGLYVAQDITISFIGVEVLDNIPTVGILSGEFLVF